MYLSLSWDPNSYKLATVQLHLSFHPEAQLGGFYNGAGSGEPNGLARME